MSILRNMSVAKKFLAIGFLSIALTVVVAGVGIATLRAVGAELTAIAERDIPLMEIVTKTTVHQLEQAVEFERAVRHGEAVARGGYAGTDFTAAVAEFDKLGTTVEQEIETATTLAGTLIEEAATPEEKQEFTKVRDVFQRTATEREEYVEHAKEVFALLAAGNASAAAGKLQLVEKEQETLIHTLEGILFEIEHFTLAAAKSAAEHERTGERMMIILTVAVAIFSIGLIVFVVRRAVAGPLGEVVAALNALAAGDTTVDVEIRAEDEIGAVAKAFQTFKRTAIEAKQLAEEQKQAELRAEQERRDLLLKMADDLESGVKSVIDTLVAATTETRASADAMADTAQRTNQQAAAVAAASDQTASNVQSVAGAAEELGASVQEVSRQISTVDQMVQRAVEKSQGATETVTNLSQAAQRIGEVINLINDIAEQTNLLALNATIEAARAGAAGKGFAVVASEVKALATQTAKATEEISSQITSVQAIVRNTAGAIDEIRTDIVGISEAATTVASAVEEQNAATQEIAANVQQAAQGTQEVSRSIASVTEAADETGQSAGALQTAADDLSQQAEKLNQALGSFLSELRAA